MPNRLIVIDGRDVERIDVSQGMNRARTIGAWVGTIVGFGAGFAAVAMESTSTSETIAYGTALGGLMGLLGYLAGEPIGALFERESWRRIR